MDDHDPLQCPICFEWFQDPRILPCGHSFCFECLERCKIEKCPTCRKICGPLCKIPVNYSLQSIVAKSQEAQVHDRARRQSSTSDFGSKPNSKGDSVEMQIDEFEAEINTLEKQAARDGDDTFRDNLLNRCKRAIHLGESLQLKIDAIEIGGEDWKKEVCKEFSVAVNGILKKANSLKALLMKTKRPSEEGGPVERTKFRAVDAKSVANTTNASLRVSASNTSGSASNGTSTEPTFRQERSTFSFVDPNRGASGFGTTAGGNTTGWSWAEPRVTSDAGIFHFGAGTVSPTVGQANIPTPFCFGGGPAFNSGVPAFNSGVPAFNSGVPASSFGFSGQGFAASRGESYHVPSGMAPMPSTFTSNMERFPTEPWFEFRPRPSGFTMGQNPPSGGFASQYGIEYGSPGASFQFGQDYPAGGFAYGPPPH